MYWFPRILITTAAIGLALNTAIYADEVQHVVWDKAPITINLPVGQERMITFPGEIKLGFDATKLPGKTLSVVNNNHTLYLTAHKNFGAEPARVLMVDSGKIILLTLSANASASDTPLSVLLTQPHQDTDVQQAAASADDSYVTLVRFAAQQLYAPERLLTQPLNIHRIAMQTKKTVPLLLDGSITANPLMSWKNNDTYVTAVEVYNMQKTSLTLNLGSFCGQWRAVSAFPRTVLDQAFSPLGNTTVFLVSSEPFAEAIAPCEGRVST